MHLRALIHLVKVAGAVTLRERIIVLGSSSLLATFEELGEAGNLLEPTYDADLLVVEMDDRSARLLDELIGEGSQFRQHFGYYADLLRLAITDVLAVAKLRAGRPKDLALLTALLATGRLKAETVRERLAATRMPEAAIVVTYRRLREVEAASKPLGE